MKFKIDVPAPVHGGQTPKPKMIWITIYFQNDNLEKDSPFKGYYRMGWDYNSRIFGVREVFPTIIYFLMVSPKEIVK